MSAVEVSMSREELLVALRYDCTSFFAFNLGDDLTMEVPELHESIWNEILQMIEKLDQAGLNAKLKKLFAVPRGFAKTTVAKLAAMLLLKYTRFKYVLYASKTVGHGKNAIRDIVGWFSSEQYVDLHGQMIQVKAAETEGMWIYDLPVRDFRTHEVKWKRIIFKAIGATTHIRGSNIMNQRPEIIIIDDIEDNDNTTLDLQPKLDEWFLGALWKSFATSYMVIFIGNMIRETTLLARFSKDPEWNPTVYGCIVRNKTTDAIQSLWEEKFPLTELLKEYRDYRRMGQGHVWEVEMMNLTQDEIFKADLSNAIRPPDPNPEDLEAGVLILDPKFGESAWSDDTAITVHARIKGMGIPCVIDHFKGRVIEDKMFDEMLNLSWKWGISTWVVESDVAQRTLIPFFKLLLKDRGLNETVFTILPIFTNRIAKTTRIIAGRNAVSAGTYAVSEGQEEIIAQYMAYKPNQKHEDLIDSAAHGITVWTEFGTDINQNGIKLELFQIANDLSDDAYKPDLDIAGF